MALCHGLIIDVRSNGGKLTNESLGQWLFNERTLVGYIAHKGPRSQRFLTIAPQARGKLRQGALPEAGGGAHQPGCYSATNEFVSIMMRAQRNRYR